MSFWQIPMIIPYNSHIFHDILQWEYHGIYGNYNGIIYIFIIIIFENYIPIYTCLSHSIICWLFPLAVSRDSPKWYHHAIFMPFWQISMRIATYSEYSHENGSFIVDFTHWRCWCSIDAAVSFPISIDWFSWENLHREPSIFPWRSWGFPENIPLNQSNDIASQAMVEAGADVLSLDCHEGVDHYVARMPRSRGW